MSTYLDPRKPDRHAPYSDVPQDVQAFLRYLEYTLRRSPRTVNAYYIDLRIFLRFMVRYLNQISRDVPDDEISITGLDSTFWRTINYADLLEFTNYLKTDRNNGRAANCRKVSSIKGFFRYLVKMGMISDDPARDLDLPKPAKTLPKYLSLEESLELLKNIQSDFYERDYCMLTLFLNCGMRLTELVTIDLSDFKDDTVRITGKGNKQRLVYLNPACVDAVKQYLSARAAVQNLKDKQALFISKRTGKRLTPRRVEQIVENYAGNMANRENNPFLAFSDPQIKKYMALGRSELQCVQGTGHGLVCTPVENPEKMAVMAHWQNHLLNM